MRLLILTQKVDKNDDVLGFFHRWLIEFAKRCESVVVICLWRGEYELPANVRVLSLGKELGVSRAKYVARFFRYLWQEKNNYDSVFVHMNQVYVILAGWWWKCTGKHVALWYVHRQVSLSLKIAEKFVDVIFTAAKESCRIKSDKIRVVGHGIDVSQFSYKDLAVRTQGEPFRIVTIGRITRIKNLDVFIEAARILEKENPGSAQYVFNIVGAPTSHDDYAYEAELKKQISSGDIKSVCFLGNVPYKDIARIYETHDLSVNLTPDGGLDKVVIESMASGVPCITSNNAYKIHVAPHEDAVLFSYRDPADLVLKIKYMLEGDPGRLEVIRRGLRLRVEQTFGLSQLIGNIIDTINSYDS